MIRVFQEEKVSLTNMLSENVGRDWTGVNGVVSGADSSHCILTGNGTGASPLVYYDHANSTVIGRKYYIRAKFRVTNSDCVRIDLIFGGVTTVLKNPPILNELVEVSAIVTATAVSARTTFVSVYSSSALANGKTVAFHGLSSVDLTAKYGAGFEPLVAYFNRIKNINSLYNYPSRAVLVTVNDFSTNGEKPIKPIKCLEVKQDNEDWYLDFVAESSYAEWLVQDAILIAPTKQGEQPFRINNVENDGRRISFKARHIGYDLENCVSYYTFNIGMYGTIKKQFEYLCLDSTPPIAFDFFNDETDYVLCRHKDFSALGFVNEMRETYGGHIVFDWWTVRLEPTIGADNQVEIAYGKNLQGAKVVQDWSQVCTSLMAYGNNNIFTGSNPYLATGVSYDKEYARKMVFQTDDLTELDALATAYVEQYKVPKINYTVKSDNIQNVSIGDTIKVKARQFTILTNVLGYTYNVLTSRIENVEFGNFRKDVRSVFSNIQGQLDETKKSVIQENIQMNAQISAITSKTVEVSATLANTVVTTMHTFDAQTRVMYLISGFIGSDNVTTYSCVAIVAVGSNLEPHIVYNANSAGLELTFSGMEVRLKQTTGASQTGTIVIQKIS